MSQYVRLRKPNVGRRWNFPRWRISATSGTAHAVGIHLTDRRTPCARPLHPGVVLLRVQRGTALTVAFLNGAIKILRVFFQIRPIAKL